jgi:predicted metal-dependent HD superfamily phosphohydrolase
MDISQSTSQFRMICVPLGVDSELLGETTTALIAAYSEPQRHNHTLSHISHMLDNLAKSSEPRGQLREILQFAIWFHDVTYDPIRGAPDNENQSILVWETFVRQAAPCLVSSVLNVTFCFK